MMKSITRCLSGAVILGSAIAASGALAADDLVVTSNEPIPYRLDERFVSQPMVGIDLVYPSTGGPALVLSPSLVRRASDGRWEHRVKTP
jgi:hypothetical protein